MKMRNIIFWLHLTVGIIVGAVLLIIASTGMILAFRPQIIAFAEHDIYKIAPPETSQDRLSLQELVDKVQDSAPKSKPMAITFNSDPHVPIVIKLGENTAVYVNPYTGVILGNGSSIRHWFEDVEYWHRWLGMRVEWKSLGGSIKRACNVVFFFMILTGMYLWWPQQWTAKAMKYLMRFDFELKGQARDWNWHNVIGFWCAPFLIIISLTGIIMSYPWANDLLYKMTGNKLPVISQDGQEKSHQRHHHDDTDADEDDQSLAVSLDALFTRAQQQVSDWKTITLRLSSHPDAPAVFNIEQAGVGHRSQLTLNRMNAQVIKWEPYSSQNSGRKLRTFVRYLHTGEVGGLIGQTIAFFAAGGLLLLIWTGFAKAWRRFFIHH